MSDDGERSGGEWECGVLERWDNLRGYGWAKLDGSAFENVFIHRHAWPRFGPAPSTGQRLRARVVPSGRGSGWRAEAVELIEDNNVREG